MTNPSWQFSNFTFAHNALDQITTPEGYALGGVDYSYAKGGYERIVFHDNKPVGSVYVKNQGPAGELHAVLAGEHPSMVESVRLAATDFGGKSAAGQEQSAPQPATRGI